MNNETVWEHFNRMQKACMAADSIVTRREFMAESVYERREYYNWMRSQVSGFIAGPYWENNLQPEADYRTGGQYYI